jgi:hypothetical protein
VVNLLVSTFLNGNENIDINVIPINSESSKKRLKNEIEKSP